MASTRPDHQEARIVEPRYHPSLHVSEQLVVTLFLPMHFFSSTNGFWGLTCGHFMDEWGGGLLHPRRALGEQRPCELQGVSEYLGCHLRPQSSQVDDFDYYAVWQ